MKLRINAQLIEHTCSKCGDNAYCKKDVRVTCTKCKKPMEQGVLFSASLVRFQPVIYNVNKD